MNVDVKIKARHFIFMWCWNADEWSHERVQGIIKISLWPWPVMLRPS